MVYTSCVCLILPCRYDCWCCCCAPEYGVRATGSTARRIWLILFFHGRLDLLVLCHFQGHHHRRKCYNSLFNNINISRLTTDFTACCRHVPSHRRCRSQSRNQTPRCPWPCYCFRLGCHRRRHYLLHRPRASRLARRVHSPAIHLLVHDGLCHQHHLWPGP